LATGELRIYVHDAAGTLLPGNTGGSLYLNGIYQSSANGGIILVQNIPEGTYIAELLSITGQAISCKRCYAGSYILGYALPVRCTPTSTISSPCSFSVTILAGKGLVYYIEPTIAPTPIPTPVPTPGCYLGEGVYRIDDCNAQITTGGRFGVERFVWPSDVNYTVHILKVSSTCGYVGGGIAYL